MQLIVILKRTSMNPVTVEYLLRAAVPASRQAFYANANKTSAYPETPADDLAAIRAGQYIERSSSFSVSGQTVAQIKTALVTAQAEFQARVTEDGDYNPWKFYGTNWDGTTWTTGGVS
jgi:hypothetical protein